MRSMTLLTANVPISFDEYHKLCGTDDTSPKNTRVKRFKREGTHKQMDRRTLPSALSPCFAKLLNKHGTAVPPPPPQKKM